MTLSYFDRQKSFGDDGERRVLAAFLEAGWAARRRQSFARNDIEVSLPTGTEIVEVKNEDRFSDSDNLCIEMYQGTASPRPSGIMTSESTVCVHTLGEMCIAYRTQPMRLHIEDALKRKMYFLQAFGKSDNGNGGVLANKLVVLFKPWAEQIEVANLPLSRVFNVTRE